SSHLIDEISQLLEHVLLLDAGQLVLDAPAEDLRGLMVTLTGNAEPVERIAAARAVLRRETLGSLASVTVYGALDGSERQRAAELGVEVHAAPLQQLVVHAAQIREAQGTSAPAAWTGTQSASQTFGANR